MSDLEDLFTIYHIQILDINVEMDVENVQLPNIIECKVGRSIQYIMSTIPSITNELLGKLYDVVLNSPI